MRAVVVTVAVPVAVRERGNVSRPSVAWLPEVRDPVAPGKKKKKMKST